MAIFSIWEGEEFGITLKRGNEIPRYKNGKVMDETANKIYEFEANSWEEACQKQNDYFGWGEYIPPKYGWAPLQDDWQEIEGE